MRNIIKRNGGHTFKRTIVALYKTAKPSTREGLGDGLINSSRRCKSSNKYLINKKTVDVTPPTRLSLKLSRRLRQSLMESSAKIVKIFEREMCFLRKKDFKTASLNYNQRSRSEVIPCQPASLRLESPSPIDIAKVVKILEQKKCGLLTMCKHKYPHRKKLEGKAGLPKPCPIFCKCHKQEPTNWC